MQGAKGRNETPISNLCTLKLSQSQDHPIDGTLSLMTLLMESPCHLKTARGGLIQFGITGELICKRMEHEPPRFIPVEHFAPSTGKTGIFAVSRSYITFEAVNSHHPSGESLNTSITNRSSVFKIMPHEKILSFSSRQNTAISSFRALTVRNGSLSLTFIHPC